MTRSAFRAIVPCAVAALLSATPALAQPKTVMVDCTKGKSVQKALEKKGDPLTIEISGICIENVLVRRDNVIFLGSDPALDGIRAASAVESFSAAVVVREARNIHFENLQFAGGATSGLRIENARRNISAENCLFHDNGTWGVIAVGGIVQIANSTVRDNHTSGAGGGLTAAESGQLYCDTCTVVDNPDASDGSGLSARTGGIVSVSDTTVDGVRTAAIAFLGGQVFATGSTLTGGLSGILLDDHSTAEIDTVNLAGRIVVFAKSRLQMFDTVQSTGGPNFIDSDSHLEIVTSAPGASALADDLFFSGFSEGSSFGPASFQDIVCSPGNDFDCDGTESKISSSCGLCP